MKENIQRVAYKCDFDMSLQAFCGNTLKFNLINLVKGIKKKEFIEKCFKIRFILAVRIVLKSYPEFDARFDLYFSSVKQAKKTKKIKKP